MTPPDDELIDLGVGQPDFPTPDHIKEAGRGAIDANFTRYTPQPGFDDLREAVARKFQTQNRIDVRPEQVVVSCGAKHSMYNIMQCIAGPGDQIIILTPYWFAYLWQVEHTGAKPILVPAREEDGFVPSLEEMRAAVTTATKAIVINSPCNPTGAVYDAQWQRGLAELAVQNDLLVISDEVYESILFDGAEHVSIASLSAQIAARTITVNSVSKTHAMTGWRIGYAALPLELAEKVTALQGHSTSGPCAIAQRAALEALSGDQAHVQVMLAQYVRRRTYMLERLAAIPRLGCCPPRGTFYSFVNISQMIGTSICGQQIHDCVDFANVLLEHAQVKVTAGKGFGSSRHIRLSFAVSMAALHEGLDRIERLLTSQDF